MVKTNTNIDSRPNAEGKASALINSTFELVNWPDLYTHSSLISSQPLPQSSPKLSEKVFALQTNRFSTPFILSKQNEVSGDAISPFDSFNLGLHVGDLAEKVNCNRKFLNQYISDQLINSSNSSEPVTIQWLDQVHGNQVVEVTFTSCHAITADASITRQKNIALAIMTADCLPILLSHKDGIEIAAIHGGWRPLAANIIEKTLDKMQSEPENIVAWLGPCIGSEAFEVGVEVKEAFTQQDNAFATAFVKQIKGKYLADLHKIAQMQLQSLGVKAISSLDECTYHRTEKYYSYRKVKQTGRMASIICRM
ncbi:MAG: peptidoglycan editing factor PgeF [Colwellia sp.]|nr:peptidoglycan editing factor PgeF [Colwellia sp.]